MSLGFSTSVGFSKRAHGVLALGALGGIACLVLVATPLVWSLGAVLCLAWVGIAWRRPLPQAVFASEAGMRLQWPGGREVAFEVSDVFLSSVLLVFRGREQGLPRGRRHVVALWFDSVSPETFRRAAVYGRWLAGKPAAQGRAP